MAATAAAAADLTVQGAQLRWYSPHPAVEYGFCGRCGSSMFWRETGSGAAVSISAGTLDQPTGLRTTSAWWVAEAADYHELQTGLDDHRGDG